MLYLKENYSAVVGFMNSININMTNELAKSPKVNNDLCIFLLQRKNIFELRKIVE